MSRPAAEPLRVAQIFGVKEARAFPTGDAAVVLLIGDAACAPHNHGIRASRERWVEMFAALAAADPSIAARLKAIG